MAMLGVIFAVSAVLTLTRGEYQESVYGMQKIDIFADTVEKRDFVRTYETLPGYDFLILPRTIETPVEVLVTPDKTDQFKHDLDEKNIKYNVVVEDVSTVLKKNLALLRRSRRSRGSNILSTFPKYSEIVVYLKELAEQYSGIAQVVNIGKTYEGRDLLGLKISNGTGDKPIIVIDGGIHAREWIAPTTALYAIQQLVENPTNHYLFENVDIYIIPSLNPDGYEYSQLNISTRLWRKTRSNHSAELLVNLTESCLGVDANRNFDSAWNTAGASSNPCSYSYAGPKAFSEPETAALRDFMLPLKGKIKAYITLHSYGKYLFFPWGFTYEKPKAADLLECVAVAAATEIYKHQGHIYRIGSPINLLYAASGGSMDWAMAEAGVDVSFTLELPGDFFGFAPPPNEIIPTGRETFDALAVFIKYAAGVQVC